MKVLSSILHRTKCPNYGRYGPFLPDISFSIRTETGNSYRKTHPASGEFVPQLGGHNGRNVEKIALILSVDREGVELEFVGEGSGSTA